MKRKINKKQALKYFLIVAISIVAVFVILEAVDMSLFTAARAEVWDLLYNALNNVIFNLIIRPFGYIATILVGLLIAVAGGDVKFVSMPAVANAWIVVRDVSNIFFLITLLIIAFATVLGIESYGYKKALPRLIIMAVLINFSKTICGIFTDLATVIMKSFMAAIGEGAAANILATLGVLDWSTPAPPEKLGSKNNPADTESSLTMTLLLIAVMLGVMIVVFAVWIVVLLFRLAMLWFLIILSPLAFAAYAIPGGQKYSSQWWQLFGNYIMVGPLITFFLWLSLYIAVNAGAAEVGGPVDDNPYINLKGKGTSAATDKIQNLGAFEVSDPNVLIGFLVAVMMLVAGLQLSKQMASEAGFLTNKVQQKASGAVKGWAKGAMKYGFAVTSGTGALGTGAYIAGKYTGRYAYKQGTSLAQEMGLAAFTGAVGKPNKASKFLRFFTPEKVYKNAMEKRIALREGRLKRGQISKQAIKDMPDKVLANEFLNGVDRNGEFIKSAGRGDTAKAVLKENAAAALTHVGETIRIKILQNRIPKMKGSDLAMMDRDAFKMSKDTEYNGGVSTFLGELVAHLESIDKQKARSIYNSLDPIKQKALEKAGFKPPKVAVLEYEGEGGAGAGAGGTGSKMDIDQKKFADTEDALQKDRNFFNSPEYKKNRERYYSPKEFNANKPHVEAQKRWKEMEGFGRKGIGYSQMGENMEVMLNFDDREVAGIDGVNSNKQGLSLSGKAKADAVETLVEKLASRMRATGDSQAEIDEETAAFREQLGKAKDIQLVNSERFSGDLDDILPHERGHSVVRRMPAAERKRITGGRKFATSKDEEEYITEQLVGGGVKMPVSLTMEIHNHNDIQAALDGGGTSAEILDSLKDTLQDLSFQGKALDDLQAHVAKLQDSLNKMGAEGSVTERAIQKEVAILVNKLRRTTNQTEI